MPLLANDTDPNGDTLIIESAVVTSTVPFGEPGTLEIEPGGGLLRFTPPEGFIGVQALQYTVSDGHGGSAIAAVTVTVLPLERIPGFERSQLKDAFAVVRRGDTQLAVRASDALSDDRLKSVHYGDPATLRQLFRTQLWQGRDNLRATLSTPETVVSLEQLCRVADELSIPVLCYGLRTDFRGELFEGSQYLLAWADNLVEIKTICHTGRKATMVVRVDEHGRAISDGPQVEIGGNDRYVSVSRGEFKKITAGEGRLELKQPQLPFEETR